MRLMARAVDVVLQKSGRGACGSGIGDTGETHRSNTDWDGGKFLPAAMGTNGGDEASRRNAPTAIQSLLTMEICRMLSSRN